VKGPMGMGLDINKDAHNIVFTGGTGILVFLDLVAKLVISLTDDYASEFGSKFKLTIYFTAVSEKEAIGLQLLKDL